MEPRIGVDHRPFGRTALMIERAHALAVPKPWGSADLRPWSSIQPDGHAIGEIWFQRPDSPAPGAELLFKLLFARQPLSIQVHPDDAFARSIGLPHGKTEAWYILSAAPDAKVALGLKQPLTPAELRAAIDDGSIAELVDWRGVREHEVYCVPAGTIHAIGAGLVVAEIQQNSDATFRIFDHGRGRELHVDHAVAAARAEPYSVQSAPARLTDVRTLLAAGEHFVLERITLPPESIWELHARRETWMFVLDGEARAGSVNASVGDTLFLESDRARLATGRRGLTALLSYLGPKPIPELLRNLDGLDTCWMAHLRELSI
jgi:mannose-6-phosphate isomerase